MKYQGSCHCGNIKFEAEGEIESALACNCSICSRKGTLLWFVPSTQFKLLTSRENITTYTFNKHVIKHQFCGVCGVQTFGEAKDPKGVDTFAVNIRCLENIDPLSVPVHHYDGKSI
ncbi:MAG: GFA family protein [Cellvibrio sp.]